VSWLPLGVRAVAAHEAVSAAELNDVEDQARGVAYGRRIARDVILSAARGGGTATHVAGTGYVQLAAGAGANWRIPIRLPLGSRIFAVRFYAQTPTGGSVTVDAALYKTTAAQSPGFPGTFGVTGAWGTAIPIFTTGVLYVDAPVVLVFTNPSGGSTIRISAVKVTTDAIARLV
jgi:hypothetical protein